MTRLTCAKCNEGWICERHPDQPWPDESCSSPAMPCDVPTCPYRIEFRAVTKRTGLICPRCRQAVATIADEGAAALSSNARDASIAVNGSRGEVCMRGTSAASCVHRAGISRVLRSRV